jgi:acyl-CoA synthetase (AMP-forming)/AMP-acid ligase II
VTSLAAALRAGALAHPATTLRFAGSGPDQEISLAEVLERGEAVAYGLAALGVDRGDAVAIQVPNRVEGAVAYAAAMLLGAVIVPVIHIYGPAEVGFILRQSGARVLIVPNRWHKIDFVRRVRDLGETPVETVVVIGDDVPSNAVAWSDLEEGGHPPFEVTEGEADDVALLIYTSGTTGEPKGVRHTNRTLLAEVGWLADSLPESSGATVLGAFPAGHIAGVLSLLRSFLRGTSSVMLDTWDAARAAVLVERYRVTSASGTPYFLTSLVEAADAGGHDISSLDVFLVGAANVPRSVVEMADARGIAAFRSYGSTEHPTISSGSPTDPVEARAGTDGRLTPGTEVRIVDEAGDDLPDGRPGEILSRGPELFVGYSDPSLDDEAFAPGGWFRTGDIGVMSEGYLTIVDRKKDIIIRGGENISSKEVEDLLVQHPAVADAAAVAAPDPRLGEKVCAFVVLRPGCELDLEGIRRHFEAAGVAIQKTPERLEVVSELPRGHGGKVLKVELRRQLSEGATPGGAR